METMTAAYPVEIFQTEDGQVLLEVQLSGETVWLSQAQLVMLFARDQSVISRHVRNIFKEGELAKESNMQKMHIAGSDKPVAFSCYTSNPMVWSILRRGARVLRTMHWLPWPCWWPKASPGKNH